MIRSANHSSFPKVGEHPLDQQLRAVLNRHARARATVEEVRAAEDEATTIAVAQQSRAFVDVVTDGMVHWDGPLAHPARHLDGMETRGLRRWFSTHLYDRQVAIVGAVSRPAPFLVHSYEVAVGVALSKPVKVVLPGPVLFARSARDEHYGDLDLAADAIASALATEVRDLAAAGARIFQLDEPLLCEHPDDVERVARTAALVFGAAGTDATTILSTYFGDMGALADRLQGLPGTYLGLDMTTSGVNFDLLERLPVGRGVALGLFDATTTRQEDAADVAELLEPYRESLQQREVIVGPNAGLELLPRDQAFDKLLHSRYLVEKLTAEWEWA